MEDWGLVPTRCCWILMKCSDFHIKGWPPVSLFASLVAFLILFTFKPRPHGGIHIVCSEVKAQAASSWLCQQPIRTPWAAVISNEAMKPADWGQSQRAVISQSHFIGGACWGNGCSYFGISAFDKEASSDHCWFLFFSFVQSTNSSLVFSGYETNRHSWWKFK